MSYALNLMVIVFFLFAKLKQTRKKCSQCFTWNDLFITAYAEVGLRATNT